MTRPKPKKEPSVKSLMAKVKRLERNAVTYEKICNQWSSTALVFEEECIRLRARNVDLKSKLTQAERQLAEAYRVILIWHDRSKTGITLKDCLEEINNALNYWYPSKFTSTKEECDARHVRLFGFRDKLSNQPNP